MTLFLIVVGLTAFLALLGWLRWRYLDPLQQVHDWAEQLANQTPFTSVIPSRHEPFSRIAHYFQKISDRQNELSKRLEEKDFFLQAVLESMREGVIVVDQAHVIRLTNRQLLTFFDLKRSPLGQTVLEALREAPIEMLVRETMENREICSEEFSPTRLVNGSHPQKFQITSVPIKSEFGQVTGAVIIFYDVTLLKRAEQARRELIANVSHELRTPLSIFRGYLETLLDEEYPCPEEIRRILGVMSRHSNRLNFLVDDLMTLARLELRRIELDPVPIQIQTFLTQILADWQRPLQEKKLSVTLEVAGDLPALEVDPFRIEQVLTNLLENAIKYSSDGGQITLRASVAEENMVLEVQDSGIGIPAADLPHIFERFYRVDKARSREQGGTGLGLSIVKHIVQLHGGSVNATSELGKGTVIRLRLPLIPPLSISPMAD